MVHKRQSATVQNYHAPPPPHGKHKLPVVVPESFPRLGQLRVSQKARPKKALPPSHSGLSDSSKDSSPRTTLEFTYVSSRLLEPQKRKQLSRLWGAVVSHRGFSCSTGGATFFRKTVLIHHVHHTSEPSAPSVVLRAGDFLTDPTGEKIRAAGMLRDVE